jgi:hypothetical protein
MKERTKGRIRPTLLVLLWVWAGCVFVVVDLFRNVPELDRVRPQSKLYEGMRKAAHEMVGEPYEAPAFVAEASFAARRRMHHASTDAPAGALPPDSGRRSAARALERAAQGRLAPGAFTKWNDPAGRPGAGEYLDGRRDGTWRWTWPDGTTREERTYKAGVLDGVVRTFYEGGAKQLEERYRDGKPDGTWRWWHAGGATALEAECRDGRLDGAVTGWHANGRKAVACRYADGKLAGRLQAWHADGALAAEGEFENGKRNGRWSSWDETGRLITDETYENGRKVG